MKQLKEKKNTEKQKEIIDKRKVSQLVVVEY